MKGQEECMCVNRKMQTLLNRLKRTHQSKPLKELRSKKTDSSFAAHHHGTVDVVVDWFASKKISGRVTDAVSTLLKL